MALSREHARVQDRRPAARRAAPVTPSSIASTRPPTASRPPAGRTPSPRARRSRSPPVGRARRRRPRARSTARARCVRHEPDRLPDANGPCADDHPWQSFGRRQELVNSLLGREAADEEHMRRLFRLADRLRNLDAARDHPHVRRAELAGRSREKLRRRDRQLRPAQDRPEEPRRTPRELDVTAPELDHVWLAARERSEPGRQPMRMDEVGIACGSPRGACVAEQKRRQEQHEPGSTTQVSGDPVPVGDAEVPERRRRDDLDLHSLRTHGLDRVTDEEARHVPLVPRVRGRQDDDLHWRRRAKTIGAASASIANAKK